MSVQISFKEFEKMLDKECLKRTSHSLKEYPSIWVEDFWPVSLEETLPIQEAKDSMENCLESIFRTL